MESQAGSLRLLCYGLKPPKAHEETHSQSRETNLKVAAQADVMWSMDFMHYALYGGRKFRTLNVLDEGVREA